MSLDESPRLVKHKVGPWRALTNLQGSSNPRSDLGEPSPRLVKPKVFPWWASTDLQGSPKPNVRPWWASTSLQGLSYPRSSLGEPWWISKAHHTQGLSLVSLDESPWLVQTQGPSLVSPPPLVKSLRKSLRPWVRSSAKQKGNMCKLIGKTFNLVEIKPEMIRHYLVLYFIQTSQESQNRA